jgi:ADP-heptose:LPS heptosyltransferase
MSTPSAERGQAWLRLIDRYLGIPLVVLLGARPKKKRLPAFSTLGLLQTAAIGDTVLMSGLLADLRRSFPDVRIVLFTGPSNYQIAQLLTGPDRVVKLPVGNPLEAVRILRAHKVDVLCDFGPWPRLNALCAALSGASFLIGFRAPGEYRHFGYDQAVDHSARVHELENQRALIRALGVESTSRPSLKVDVPLPAGLSSKGYLVFHAWPAGYRAYLKEWPRSHWLRLAEGVRPLDYAVALTGGPADVEQTEALASCLEPCLGRRLFKLAGKTSLPETVRVLREAAAVVSVNTGIVHLAAAVETPVISLNGPTNSARWGPIGPNAISIDAEGPDCGYLNLGFEYRGHREDCMSTIRPERVLEALRRVLAVPAAQGSRGCCTANPA